MLEYVAGAYRSNVGADTCGVQPVTRGVETVYKPWYYDGKSVHWDWAYTDFDTAVTQALTLRDTILNEAKHL